MSVIGHNKPPLDPKETIQSNINRKKPILDRDPQYFNNTPLPSWIELSLIDVCNRACSFCPKSDDSIAPNTHQRMTMTLINKLVEDLKKINVPVIWSLHDMWPITGGRHYNENCNLFVKDCSKCKVLGIDNCFLSKFGLKRKKNTYKKMKNLTFVPTSKWIESMAKHVKT